MLTFIQVLQLLILFLRGVLFSMKFPLCLDVVCQVKWLMRLSQIPEFTEVPNFSEDAQSFLQGIIGRFSTSDAFEIMDIEDKTNEGVEAVEYFLKQKCRSHPEIAKVEICLSRLLNSEPSLISILFNMCHVFF